MTAPVSHRRAIAWLCIVITLWLGLAAQRHALGHALQAMHPLAAQDEWLGHAQACEQCLQFAAVDAAAVASPTLLPRAAAGDSQAAWAQLSRRAERFTAYGPRAPPRVG